MSEQRRDQPEAPASNRITRASRDGRLPAWPGGREGRTWFTLLVLAAGVVIVMLLQGMARSRVLSQPTTSTTPAAPSAHGAAAANERVYSLPQTNPGLMTPAVDAQGRIWVGEMAENKLAMLDPSTGKVQSWAPPGGAYNIMQIAADKAGVVWFAEEAANYIGRFDPTTQTFQTYPLGQVNGHTAGPEALALDAHGAVWFTEVTGNALGHLDPTTGQITNYSLPPVAGNSPAYPYALAIAPDGTVWYGDLGGGQVGKLDPTTGKVTPIALSDTKAQIYSMAIGPDGAVWFTELLTDTFGRIDPQTNAVTTVKAPHTLGNPATLYNVARRGSDLWFTSTGANALLRYTPATSQFNFYTLKTPSSVPFGLAVANDGALWFTADGTPNYIGAVRP